MFLTLQRTGLKPKKVSRLLENVSQEVHSWYTSPSNSGYDTDSIYAIKRWTQNNTYEKVSQRSDFNIYTLFLAAYDIQPDNSPPPISREERKKWKPLHQLRIVLCSIAMAMNFPLLQLKPSLQRYLCICADSTFKLTIFKSIKVFLFLLYLF